MNFPLKIYKRSRWTPSARGGVLQSGPYKALVVHYTVTRGANKKNFKQQAEHMRLLRQIHLNNGWDDLGYNFVLFQAWGFLRRPRIFEGRGWNRVPAAQAGYNTGTITIAVVLYPGEKLKRSTIRKLKSFYRHTPTKVLRGHRDYNSTSCPGDKLYNALPEIRKAK